MEGIWFIWFMWVSWIICTFYLKKSKIRTRLGFWLLAIIILYSQAISVASFEISLSYLLMAILCCWLISKYKTSMKLYIFFISMVITCLFAGLHLVELYDPVMFLLVDKMWVIAFLVAIVTIVLIKTFEGRIVVSIIGLIQGELIFKKFLTTIYGMQPLGSGTFFDITAVCCIVIIAWQTFELFCEYMAQYIKKLPTSRGEDMRVFR